MVDWVGVGGGRSFYNYHDVKLTLRKDRLECMMFRMAEPENAASAFEAKDRFSVRKK